MLLNVIGQIATFWEIKKGLYPLKKRDRECKDCHLVTGLMDWDKETLQEATLRSSKCACAETVYVLFYTVANPCHMSESTLENCVQINTNRFRSLPVTWKNLLNIC